MSGKSLTWLGTFVWSIAIMQCSVTALNCPKLSSGDGTTTATSSNSVYSEGLYLVKTVDINSKELVASLQGLKKLECYAKDFKAILQPWHIKQLCNNEQVKSITLLQQTRDQVKCNKLLKSWNRSTISDSYIVVTEHGRTTRDTAAVISSVQLASDNINSSVMIAGAKAIKLGKRNGMAMKMNDAALKYVCDSPIVDYIEEDQEISIASPTTPWHLDRINQVELPLDQKYSSPNDGSDVDIYIVDTGIKYDHREFDDGRATYPGFDVVDSVHNEHQKGMDCHGHGTHVAGLAGGRTYGVAKAARLYSVRVVDCKGFGLISWLIKALEHIIDHVQKKQKAYKNTKAIINMSLVTKSKYYSNALSDAITDAVDRGILVVAAAGNYNTDACQYSPASFSNVVTVGGTQRNDKLYKASHFGSNYGSCVDIFAPGQNVESAGITSKQSTDSYDGTSQAAPLVSGAAAVYWNVLPGVNATAVKEFLLDTCVKEKLNFALSMPFAMVKQTKNCLLHLITTTTSRSIDETKTFQRVFHDVELKDAEKLIKEMAQERYTLSYLKHYKTQDKVILFDFIFNFVGDQKFTTVIFKLEKEMEMIDDKMQQLGFHISFVYDLKINNKLNYFVVFKQSDQNIFQTHFRVNPKQLKQVNMVERLQGMSLLSTSVSGNRKTQYTMLYSDQIATPAHFLHSVEKSTLISSIYWQRNTGYYLKHLSSFVRRGKEVYSLVFHKQTKSPGNYKIIYISEHKLQTTVDELIEQGHTINVLAKLQHSIYILTYESG